MHHVEHVIKRFGWGVVAGCHRLRILPGIDFFLQKAVTAAVLGLSFAYRFGNRLPVHEKQPVIGHHAVDLREHSEKRQNNYEPVAQTHGFGILSRKDFSTYNLAIAKPLNLTIVTLKMSRDWHENDRNRLPWVSILSSDNQHLKKEAPMAMTVEIRDNKLCIEIDMQKPEPSASGKTLVVASTKGNVVTPVIVDGKPVTIGLNAYIKK